MHEHGKDPEPDADGLENRNLTGATPPIPDADDPARHGAPDEAAGLENSDVTRPNPPDSERATGNS